MEAREQPRRRATKNGPPEGGHYRILYYRILYYRILYGSQVSSPYQ